MAPWSSVICLALLGLATASGPQNGSPPSSSYQVPKLSSSYGVPTVSRRYGTPQYKKYGSGGSRPVVPQPRPRPVVNPGAGRPIGRPQKPVQRPVGGIPQSASLQSSRPLKPIQPIQPIQPAKPVHVQPARPVQPVQPAKPIHVQPARPVQPAKPIHVQPARPVQPVQPAKPIHVQPARPIQPAKPIHVQPARPVPIQPARPVPVQKPVQVQPARPVAVQPAVQPVQQVQPAQGGRLYVSWENPRHSGGQYTWDQAAGECRQLGLRLVSLTSPQKEQEINRRLPRGGRKVEFYWTSGQRLSEGGQFVWNDGARTPVCNRGQGCYQNWGPTGGAGRPQPDNREGRENCLAILNEFYPGEGIVWHDIGCHHRKHFVCE